MNTGLKSTVKSKIQASQSPPHGWLQYMRFIIPALSMLADGAKLAGLLLSH